MCFPAAFALASAGISAAGSVMGGVMQQSQAKAQQAAYDRQATMERQQGEFQAGQKQDEVNGLIGRQIAMTGDSGVTLAGSPTDVISNTASQGALDTEAIRWGSKVRADTFTYQGQLAKMQGQNAFVGGIVGAAGGLLGGLGKFGATPQPTAKNPNATYFGNLFGTT